MCLFPSRYYSFAFEDTFCVSSRMRIHKNYFHDTPTLAVNLSLSPLPTEPFFWGFLILIYTVMMCLQMQVLGHQQAQWWLKCCTGSDWWIRITFVGKIMLFKMAEQIWWNFTALCYTCLFTLSPRINNARYLLTVKKVIHWWVKVARV